MGQQRIRYLDSITDSMDKNLTNSGRHWRTEEPGMLWFMRSQRVRHDLVTEQHHHQIFVIFHIIVHPINSFFKKSV